MSRCSSILTHVACLDILGKRIAVCYDLDSKFNLDQATWKSMVSGESVQIHQLRSKGVMTDWKTPLIFAGNELMPWKDSGGAASRRLIIFRFRRKPKKIDGGLYKRMMAERGAWLWKITHLYFDMVDYIQEQKTSFDAVLPSYFNIQRKHLQSKSNPMVAFLCDEDYVDVQRENHCSKREFMAKFNAVCSDMGWARIDAQQLEEGLAGFGIEELAASDPRNTHNYSEKFLTGVQLAE